MPDDNTTEPQTLTEALQVIKKLKSESAAAAEKRAKEIARNLVKQAGQQIGKLAADLDAERARANELAAKLANPELEFEMLAAVTQERDGLRVDLDRATKNVALLEGLCGVKGIDPENAVVTSRDFPGALTLEHFEEKMRNAKTPAERRAVSEELSRAIKEKRIQAKR